MFARLIATSLCVLTLAGCGLSPAMPRTTSAAKTTAADYSGCYLALTFDPSPEVADTESRLRQQLGFLDLSHAIPPRMGEELHLTVGYFRDLRPYQAEKIAETFRGKDAYVYINGYGVVNQQVVYFTIQGAEEPRQTLTAMGVQYSADDPHVTFGVCPGNPRDLHGVPKKAQQAIGPYKFLARFHLKQGTKNLW
ncbi:MAG TPA: hypothetical protein V6D05_08635 [Stenomitos sp.]